MMKNIFHPLLIILICFSALSFAQAATPSPLPVDQTDAVKTGASPNDATDTSGRRFGAVSNERATFWIAAGEKFGHVRYRIGGNWNNYSEGTAGSLHFPVSELKWPINAIVGEVGAQVRLGKRWELRASVSRNLTNNLGDKMEDSDWDYDPELYGSEPDVYSESITDYVVYGADAGVRFWILDRRFGGNSFFAMGLGAGFFYQDSRWVASNLDQWYPREPGLGHVYAGGPVVTYQSWVKMPYAEVFFKSGISRFDLSGSFSGSPLMWVRDEDQHLLRNRIMTTNATGFGLKGSLQGNYHFTNNWFAGLRLNVLYFNTKGVQDSHVYADTVEGGFFYPAGYSWDIEHKIDSVQIDVMITAGFRF